MCMVNALVYIQMKFVEETIRILFIFQKKSTSLIN